MLRIPYSVLPNLLLLKAVQISAKNSSFLPVVALFLGGLSFGMPEPARAVPGLEEPTLQGQEAGAKAVVPPVAAAVKTAPEVLRDLDSALKQKRAEDAATKSEQEVLREWAAAAIKEGDYAKAEAYFLKILSYPDPKEAKRQSLLDLGRMLEEKVKNPAKAVAVYEQVMSYWQNDPEAADVNLRLGRLYRQMGAYKLALAKFYNVLYASLRVKDAPDYKKVTLDAQLEIARTHQLSGNWQEAGKFYSRLKLLELPPEEKAEVYFRSVEALHIEKDRVQTVAAAKEFLTLFANARQAPECQYLLIQNLKALDRKEDAVVETVKLLKAEQSVAKEHPESWAYWQQRTGNELGNELYASGSFTNALTVYQTLAELSDVADWRLPAVYQIGLCFERLRHPERARTAYAFILEHSGGTKPDEAKAGEPKAAGGVGDLGLNIGTLREMAQWRMKHLDWAQRTDATVAPLLSKKAAGDGAVRKAAPAAAN